MDFSTIKKKEYKDLKRIEERKQQSAIIFFKSGFYKRNVDYLLSV